MELTLPIKGWTVVLYEYIPQDLQERIQELSAPDMKVDMRKMQAIDVNNVAEELGIEEAEKIRNAPTDEEREGLLNEARLRIVQSEVAVTFTLPELHAIGRIRNAGMIESIDGIYDSVKDDAAMAEKIIAKLPLQDYELLSKHVNDLFSSVNEEKGKSSGQSKKQSSASKTTAQNTEGKQST